LTTAGAHEKPEHMELHMANEDGRMINRSQRVAHHGLILLCLGLLLGGCARHGSLSAGDQYQASGQYRAAYIEAKKVLQRDPDNGQAWLLLGKASLQLGNSKDALSDLQNARKHGVQAPQWAVPLGRALLVSGKLDELLKTLPDNPRFAAAEAAQVAVLRGDAYLGLKQADHARQAYQAALALDPKEPQALTGLARLAQQNNDPAAADRYLQQALAAAPHSPQAWIAKADLAYAAGNFADAESAYAKALGFKQADWLPQERFSALARLAETQTQRGEFDNALTHIGQLEKMAPGQPYPHYLHAVVAYQQGHLDDAVAQLQQVLQVSPDSTSAQFLLGAVNYAQGNYSQSQMYLSNVLGADPENVGARRLQALMYFREGHSAEALATLRATVKGNPSDATLQALLQRAIATGAATPKSLAVAGSRLPPATSAPWSAAAASADHDAFADVRQALARDDTTKAISLLQAQPAAGATAASERTELLAIAYIRAKQSDQAVKVAAAHAAEHPQNSSAHVLYGTVLVAAGQRDKARSEYVQAYKLDPGNLAALMDLGSLDAAEGHAKDAAGHYQAVLQKDPHNSAAMVALGRLAVRTGDKATAIQRFKQAIAAEPKASAAYVTLIMLYSEDGQFDAAAGIAKQLAQAHPDNPTALNALGAAELNAGQPRAALAPLQQAVKLAPQNTQFRTNLARAQILNQDPKAAETNLTAVVKADPAQVKAVMLLAFMRLHDNNLADALALAKKLGQQPASRVAGLTLTGDLYMASKSYAKAAQAYQQGLDIRPDGPLVGKSFLALSASGAKDPAAILRKWLAKHPDDDATRLLLAGYAMDHAQNASAAAEYAKVLQRHPSNVDALNNLAWIYIEQRNPEALALAGRAYKLAPASAGVSDTYGWALVAANQPEAALPILARAAKAAPGTPAIQYHLAVAQARTGHTADALATLGGLQKSGDAFPDKQAADKLYQTLASAGAQGSRN
jgi:putative PEP-CTERM system TPR-repeat lipoprotein